MHTIELITTTGKPIYTGDHHHINDAIESAIKQNICLDRIDLSNKSIRHINLDGIRIENASFKGADLKGANMSESTFVGCNFSRAHLEDACFCYTNIIDCNLKLSHFRDTDISMSSIENCDFEGFSALGLKFHKAYKTDKMTYTHFNKKYPLTLPPTLIQAGDVSMAIINNILFLKDIPHTYAYKNTAKRILSYTTEDMQSLVDFAKTNSQN